MSLCNLNDATYFYSSSKFKVIVVYGGGEPFIQGGSRKYTSQIGFGLCDPYMVIYNSIMYYWIYFQYSWFIANLKPRLWDVFCMCNNFDVTIELSVTQKVRSWVALTMKRYGIGWCHSSLSGWLSLGPCKLIFLPRYMLETSMTLHPMFLSGWRSASTWTWFKPGS